MKESTTGPRILIAEDAESVATLLGEQLSSAGYQVEFAADGAQCLERVGAFNPALIILDLLMPKLHGIEVLRRLKADPATQSVGVIICTAKKYKPDLDQAFELGAFDILLKPFAKEDLLQAVGRFFSGASGGEVVRAATSTDEAYLPEIGPGHCFFRLWGTRGSLPVSGQSYVRHGGNTSCVEIGSGDSCLIVDAGTGIRELGLKLAREGPRRLHILISHTHWDHIQGFPFFAPAYIPGFELVFHGASSFKKDLQSVFSGQLDRDYFPVQFEDMRAKIEFQVLEDPMLTIDGIQVAWEYTHHPSATVGFKFALGGKTLAYVSDNEFLYGYLDAPHGITLDNDILTPHRRLVDFLSGVDTLLAEAQYSNEEYQHKIGWGHSSLSNACLLARLAHVRRWIVTHHDPIHSDDFLDHKLNVTKEVMRSLGHPIEVLHAYDGLTEYW